MISINIMKSKPTEHIFDSLFEIFNRKVVLFLLFIVLSLFITSITSQMVLAEKPVEREKTVTSIIIKPGDTLWSIAYKYYSEEYKDISSFIEVIKESNSLGSDQIHAGNYLIIPFYKDVIPE